MESNQQTSQPNGSGALVGSIIIIVILVIGAIYFWQTSLKDRMQKHIPVDSTQNSNTNDTSSISSSAASLDTQLNGVNINGLDSGI
jgi:uncharacterized protein YxeA